MTLGVFPSIFGSDQLNESPAIRGDLCFAGKLLGWGLSVEGGSEDP